MQASLAMACKHWRQMQRKVQVRHAVGSTYVYMCVCMYSCVCVCVLCVYVCMVTLCERFCKPASQWPVSNGDRCRGKCRSGTLLEVRMCIFACVFACCVCMYICVCVCVLCVYVHLRVCLHVVCVCLRGYIVRMILQASHALPL